MANLDIVVDNDGNSDVDNYTNYDDALVSWVMERVKAWEDHRDQNYKEKWNEYYRLWRGVWEQKDKNRDSERSKLVSPALSQAIEATVSELEEATFGSGKWFDVDDNFADEDKTDISIFRDQLDEDLRDAGVPDSISEIYLNGAIYGTGIGKIILEEVDEKQVQPEPIGDTDINSMSVISAPRVQVGLIPVHPQEFVIDPSAKNIKDALGMAHITIIPKHVVETKQKEGVYEDVQLSDFSEGIVTTMSYDQKDSLSDVRNQDKVLLVEYHGLVPRQLLPIDLEDGEEVERLFDDEEQPYIDESDLVEAIVTIGNSDSLLRAVETPYVMKDRCFLAYQHDTVPNRFWGRGIAEKGYNPQKALDAEMRGRIDAMALTIHPMMAMDATRIHRGANFKIAPGRTIFTNGDPKGILMPFQFGQVNNNTFAQSGELERMVQMGTGAMDSATPLSENRRNETSSGMSMIMSGAIKRSKRTLANIERNFIKPFIHQSAWRYMQFAPNRYPVQDVHFQVNSTLGMVARELEQQQLANMLNTVPAESPAFWMLLKGIYEHSSISNREQMLEIIDAMTQQSLQAAMQPDQQDPMLAIKQQELQLKQQIEQAKLQIDAEENNQQAQLELERLKLEYEKLRLKEQEIIMDAKVELAKMEQDSAVTIAQMSQTQANEDRKSSEPREEKEKSQAPVINIGGGTRKISVQRTENGLEGISEEQ